MIKPIPKGFHTVTPYVVLKDSRKAIEFYQKAFGAEELFLMPGPDGKGVVHAEIRIGDSIIMLSDENPHEPCKSAESIGGSPVSFYLYVEHVDEAFARAINTGASSMMPVQEMFWGDRIGAVKDPFGHNWTLATHTKDLTVEEIEQGAKEAFSQMSCNK
ncbi:MAG: VOC family protein [Deltaproteobacteria bacterium]|nr:VOC family protein [Deltaproteobacteria bacterium]TLN00752.1 MAG: VOC family protein [bacterium]